MTRVHFLDHLRAVLTEAVLAGAGRILRVRRDALTTLRYKAAAGHGAGELVTLADERSDAAMSAVFERHLSTLSPAVGWHLESQASVGPATSRAGWARIPWMARSTSRLVEICIACRRTTSNAAFR